MKVVTLQEAAEVAAVRDGRRRIHLEPTSPQEMDRFREGEVLSVRLQAKKAKPYRSSMLPPERRDLSTEEIRKLMEPVGVEQTAREAPCRVMVKSVELLPLEALTARDAQLLTGDQRAKVVKLARWWMDRYDHEWTSKPQEERDRLDSMVVMKRFRELWHPWQVWRVTWTSDPSHRTRLLAADAGELYVESAARALPNAGEAVPPDYQEQISEEVRVREARARATAATARKVKAQEVASSLDALVPVEKLTPRDRRMNRMIAHQVAAGHLGPVNVTSAQRDVVSANVSHHVPLPAGAARATIAGVDVIVHDAEAAGLGA